MSMYLTTKLFIPVTIVSMILVLLPLAWQWKGRNTATCYFIFFCLMGCVIHLVNGIIWRDNVVDHAPVWCDISAKLQIGLSVGLPLASLSINRRLYNSANLFRATDQKRDMIIDTVICVGGTIVFMAVHYTQQGHRYNLIESLGCWPSTYLTNLGWALVMAPPVLISLVSTGFCAFAIRGFLAHRRNYNDLLRHGRENDNGINYFRLMLLSATELLFGLPISTYFFTTSLYRAITSETGVPKWKSWKDTHLDFSRVDKATRFMFASQGQYALVSLEMSRWIFPISIVLFFCFFGFSRQAYRSYYELYAWVISKVFRKRLTEWEELGRTKMGTPSLSKHKFNIFGRTIVIFPKVQKFDAVSRNRNELENLDVELAVGPTTPGRRHDSDGFSFVSAASVEINMCNNLDDLNGTDTGAAFAGGPVPDGHTVDSFSEGSSGSHFQLTSSNDVRSTTSAPSADTEVTSTGLERKPERVLCTADIGHSKAKGESCLS